MNERGRYGWSWVYSGAGIAALGLVLLLIGVDGLARLALIVGGVGVAFGLFDVARSVNERD